MTFEQAQALARGPEGDVMTLWPERAFWLWESAGRALKIDGEFWECGVYRGGSARLLAELIQSSGREHRLRLFDTFEGFKNVLPEDGTFHAAKDGEMKHWSAIDLAVESVRLHVPMNFVSIHPGYIPDSLTGLEGSHVAFAYLDMDLYAPTLGALKFLLPCMSPGGIIVVDDCGDPNWPGVEQAVREMGLEYEKRNCINPYEPKETAYVGWRAEIQL